MEMHMSRPLADTGWKRVRQSVAAGDHLAANAPGSIAPVGSVPCDDTAEKHRLVVQIAPVQEIDCLELDRGGQRRAKLGADMWSWLAP